MHVKKVHIKFQLQKYVLYSIFYLLFFPHTASLASASTSSTTSPSAAAAAAASQQENPNYEIDSIVQKMETLNATQEDLEVAEIARRFDSIGEAGVEVAQEAMEDLGSPDQPKELELKDRFNKFIDDSADPLTYVDFLNRENPGDYPTMRFDVSYSTSSYGN